jgi:hypothetical protein
MFSSNTMKRLFPFAAWLVLLSLVPLVFAQDRGQDVRKENELINAIGPAVE